jgi:hypothetical protein
MNQEVIRDFLNLPGIDGFALIYNQAQPFFYIKDFKPEIVHKDVLFQGILQVVETIPKEFDLFEFCFTNTQGSLYRLQSDAVLLILRDETSSNLADETCFQSFRSWIEADLSTAISTLSAQLQSALTAAGSPSSPSLQECLSVLNQLCEFTTQYLGAAVIVNYLKSSRPDIEWLHQFQIERAPQITFLGELSKMEQPMTQQEIEWLRKWVSAFIRRCSQVVRDYALIVEQTAHSDAEKALLLSL